MARLARVVIPDVPHHVTQRGNGRQQVFFTDADYRHYRDALAEHCGAAGVEVWAWCLMPNHVHLILTPRDADGLRRALAPVHRRHAGLIHARMRRTGHFWQGRFGTVAMDEAHLEAAIRYVCLNPVRAGLVARAQDWPWASTRAHLTGREDGVTALGPVARRCGDFRAFLGGEVDLSAFERLRKAEATGRPVGRDGFMDRLEALTGRALKPAKRGRKPKGGESE